MDPTITTPSRNQLMLPPPTPSASNAMVPIQQPTPSRQHAVKAERSSPPLLAKAKRELSMTPDRDRGNSQLPTPPSSHRRSKSVTHFSRRSSATPTAKFNAQINSLRSRSIARVSSAKSRARERSATIDADGNNPFLISDSGASGSGSSADEPIVIDKETPVARNNFALQLFSNRPAHAHDHGRHAREGSAMSFASMDSFAPYARRETTFDASDRRASRPRPRGERREGRADRAESALKDIVLPPMPTALAEAITNLDGILLGLTLKEPEVVEVDVPASPMKDREKILKMSLSAFFGEEGEDTRNDLVRQVHAEMALSSNPPAISVISRAISVFRNSTFNIILAHIKNYSMSTPTPTSKKTGSNNLSQRKAEWSKTFKMSIRMETAELRETIDKVQAEQILTELHLIWCTQQVAAILDSLEDSLEEITRQDIKRYAKVLLDLAGRVLDAAWA